MSRIGLFACAILVSVGVYAQNVERAEAKKIAENYLSMQQGDIQKDTWIVSEQFTKTNASGEVLYYVFNFESGGFVIVAGDKRANPILAYSTTNTFIMDDNHPSSVFLQGYEARIADIKATNAIMEISPKWNDIAMKKQHKAVVKEVGPLLTSIWNQNKYYNALCPDDDTKGGNNVAGTPAYDNHVPNGCVALAMAQIMYYHRYPRNGKDSYSYFAGNYGELSADFGATTYDYESMADSAVGYSDALARLIYHIGISLDMGYAPDGSGVVGGMEGGKKVYNSFNKFFKYKSSNAIDGANTPNILKDTIRQSLDKNLPVYYAACNGGPGPHGCHAFVCDGYKIDDVNVNDDNNTFYFNFGWGSSGDGWYTLAFANNYNSSCRIIVDIVPNDQDKANFFTGRDTLTATYGSFNDGSGRFNYKPNTNCEWLISPQDGRNITKITFKVGAFSLASGDTVKIYEGNNTGNVLVATLTDAIAPNTTYDVNASEALVVFISDASSEDEGFTINYTTTRTNSNYCTTNANAGTKITGKTGSFDNGSGGAEYDSENTCYWVLTPENTGTKVRFGFRKFDLAQGDFLDVFAFNGTNIPAATMWNYPQRGVYRFSLENLPELDKLAYTVDAVTALFCFRTDNNHNGTGFEVYWDTVPDVNIRDNDLGLAKFSVYPNPANDVIVVDLYADNEEDIHINFYDILGKSLYSTSTQQIIGGHQERISVGNYAKGLYMLRISTSHGTLMRKIVIE